ncbi:hypothetical protein GP475_08735 [Corynebacterium poyangense]|uniref:Uncharacterized protein n=1 Tax=Corynebacterium poyangense TaxID=2684405 RepID=A0A7H0SQ87_9CORY|nr:hypothetical protein [Corynebacterium poyangense]QNQ90712.1 hypothetical protein GP475_08735 [Corynebacterium poyangense]
MAISALGTANTIIGPSQYADMVQCLTARFKVDSPADFKPEKGSGLRVSVAQGSGFAAGARVNSTATEQVVISAPSSGSRWDAIVVRVEWQKPEAEIIAIQGNASTIPSVVSSGAGVTNNINRIPGTKYDALLAIVKVTAGRSSIDQIFDMRMWGGDGGPFRVTPDGLANCSHLDCRKGTMITTDRNANTKRLDDDGVWRDVGTASNPWKTWTPTMRYYGNDWYKGGTEGGTEVRLGTAGTYIGKYRVVDGMLDGFVSVTTGPGNHFGTGQISVDLPLPCANSMPDTWSKGHIFISTQNGADQDLDFMLEVLIKSSWRRGVLYTPVSGAYNNLKPHIMGFGNEGIPQLASGYPVGSVYTMHLSYPVEDV